MSGDVTYGGFTNILYSNLAHVPKSNTGHYMFRTCCLLNPMILIIEMVSEALTT